MCSLKVENKPILKPMKIIQKSLGLTILLLISSVMVTQAAKREFYEIKIYSISSEDQEDRLDAYLSEAYLPALHRMGISTVGVFKPRKDTEDAGKKVYVFTPLKAPSDVMKIEERLAADKAYQAAGNDYINAAYNDAPYDRFESIILKAFVDAPQMAVPNLKGPKSERFYELRSYEGPTEKLYRNKVDMFNAGGEVVLFKDLNFNAVFYGEVVTGSHMPNLMYMTTFENKEDRDAHWKSFVDSPVWDKLKSDPKYQHNVSKNTQYYLYPTEYSDI